MSNFYFGVAARIMMAVMVYATEEIAKVDEEFQNIIKGENLIIQWTVGDGKQVVYSKIESGKFSGVRDQKHPNPDITLSIKDPKIAVNVLKGGIETFQKEFDAGNLIVSGDESKIDKLKPILEIFGKYLSDLRE